jgi:hypothetical protein
MGEERIVSSFSGCLAFVREKMNRPEPAYGIAGYAPRAKTTLPGQVTALRSYPRDARVAPCTVAGDFQPINTRETGIPG